LGFASLGYHSQLLLDDPFKMGKPSDDSPLSFFSACFSIKKYYLGT
jgi:hypothetical protein